MRGSKVTDPWKDTIMYPSVVLGFLTRSLRSHNWHLEHSFLGCHARLNPLELNLVMSESVRDFLTTVWVDLVNSDSHLIFTMTRSEHSDPSYGIVISFLSLAQHLSIPLILTKLPLPFEPSYYLVPDTSSPSDRTMLRDFSPPDPPIPCLP